MRVLSKLMEGWSKIKELKKDPYSYVYSAIKLTVYSATLIADLLITKSADPDSFLNGIGTLILILMIIGIGYTSLRLGEIHENRNMNKIKVKEAWTVQSSIKKIETILTENDLIDLKVKKRNEIMSIGASNCLDYPNGGFVDKKYYINQSEYDTIDELTERLRKIYRGGRVTICSIDGISPKKTKYFREE